MDGRRRSRSFFNRCMLLMAGGMPLAELEKNNPRAKVDALKSAGLVASALACSGKRASGRHSHFEDIDSEFDYND